MSWFDEQIEERRYRDAEDFADAMDELSSIITKKKFIINSALNESVKQTSVTKAIHQILQYYRVKPIELQYEANTMEEQLEQFCRPYGIMHRTVKLDSGWYRDSVGAMLGTKKDGTVVALLPNKFFGYSYYDVSSGKKIRLNSKTEKELDEQAICFYKPFPLRKLRVVDLVCYMVESIPVSSYLMALFMMLLITLVGMLSPQITYSIFHQLIPSRSMHLFWTMMIFSIFVSIGTVLIRVVKSLLDMKISTQLEISVQAAAMARVVSLSPEFFKKYSSGELTTKIQHLNHLCSTMYSGFVMTGLSSVFSIIYISQIFQYTPTLVVPSLCIVLLTFGCSVLNIVLRTKTNRRSMEAKEKKDGLTYAIISGIQKIRLAGAEKRILTHWIKAYTEEVRHTYGISVLLLLSGTLNTAISLAGIIVIYYYALKSGVSVAEYYAFTMTYGMVTGAFSNLSVIGAQVANIRPTIELVKPILDAVPEMSTDKKVVSYVEGEIELSNVSFRYEENMPWVLNKVSLKIKPREYVAIVGNSGCGKTTLLRLLLGFETAQRGTVFYDGNDINKMDLVSLRKKIGVVMQDSRLFHGDIFSNITISSPGATIEDAWNAARIADVADDIRSMPMGMHTVVTEGGGCISGGEKQRLMIARAVVSKPKILIFDEATSALDNITQSKVSQALEKLECTRIVIAHRFSTIRNCDRIIVMDEGRIVEEGSYDKLIEQKGYFFKLAERQKADVLG